MIGLAETDSFQLALDVVVLLIELGVYSPLQAIITAGAGALVLLAFRQWFAVRLEG